MGRGSTEPISPHRAETRARLTGKKDFSRISAGGGARWRGISRGSATGPSSLSCETWAATFDGVFRVTPIFVLDIERSDVAGIGAAKVFGERPRCGEDWFNRERRAATGNDLRALLQQVVAIAWRCASKDDLKSGR